MACGSSFSAEPVSDVLSTGRSVEHALELYLNDDVNLSMTVESERLSWFEDVVKDRRRRCRNE